MAKVIYDPQTTGLISARTTWSLGRRDEAVEGFRSEARKTPFNLAAQLDFARALGSVYRHRDARRALARLNSYRRSLPQLDLLIGQVAREILLPDLARTHFERFLKRQPDSPDGWLELGHLLEHFGEYPQALDCAERVARLTPSSPLPILLRASVLSHLGRSDEARGDYQSLLARARLADGLRQRASKELASLLDASDTASALELVDGVNRTIWQAHPDMIDRGRLALETNFGFVDGLDAEFAQTLIGDSPPDHPRLAFLIGFARSGTTLLEKLLAASPEIADAEELDLFGQVVQPALVGTLKQATRSDDNARDAVSYLRERYLAGIRGYLGIGDERWLIDKNPSNTQLCESIFRVFPKARFLVMLRDPRDTMISVWFQHFPPNPESVQFLNWENLARHYVKVMSRWLRLRDMLPPDQWREVRYESMVKNPEAEMKSLGAWLGVEGPDTPQQGQPTGFVRSPSHAAIRQPMHQNRIGRWKRPGFAERFDDRLRSILEPTLTALGFAWDE